MSSGFDHSLLRLQKMLYEVLIAMFVIFLIMNFLVVLSNLKSFSMLRKSVTIMVVMGFVLCKVLCLNEWDSSTQNHRHKCAKKKRAKSLNLVKSMGDKIW